MDGRRKYGIISFVLLGLLGGSDEVWGQTEIEMDRGSLAGLKPLYVSVYVEGSAGLTGLPGLDVTSLHRAVDSTLSAHNIPLNQSEPAHVLDREPYLSVHINALDMGEGLVPFAIEVELIQGVVVANLPNELIHAATWDTGLVGLVSQDRIGTIKRGMLGLVEQFADDFRMVNPG
jgi:hypothetical protein